MDRRGLLLLLTFLVVLLLGSAVLGPPGGSPAPAPAPPPPHVGPPPTPAANEGPTPGLREDAPPLSEHRGPWTPAALEWGGAAYGEMPDAAQGLTVSGRVTDENGAAVAHGLIRGAFIRCRGGFGEYSGWGRVKDGTFVFRVDKLSGKTGWGEKPKLLDLRAPGYVPLLVHGEPETWASLEREESVAGVDLVLRRAATVEGILTDAEGKPVDGERVGFITGHREADLDIRLYCLTGKDGVFRFSEIDPRTTVWITATRWSSDYGGRVEPIPLEGRLAAGRTLRLDLRFPASTSCLIELEFADWRPGLHIRNDSSLSWFDLKPFWETREHTGYHRFSIRDPEDPAWKHRFEIRIPHGVERHHEVAVVPPPRTPK